MADRYLEVTYRNGRPVAAYLYLPRGPGDRSVRTEHAAAGILVDYSASGNVIGLEFPSPSDVTVEQVNEVLVRLGVAPMTAEELRPLRAA